MSENHENIDAAFRYIRQPRSSPYPVHMSHLMAQMRDAERRRNSMTPSIPISQQRVNATMRRYNVRYADLWGNNVRYPVSRSNIVHSLLLCGSNNEARDEVVIRNTESRANTQRNFRQQHATSTETNQPRTFAGRNQTVHSAGSNQSIASSLNVRANAAAGHNQSNVVTRRSQTGTIPKRSQVCPIPGCSSPSAHVSRKHSAKIAKRRQSGKVTGSKQTKKIPKRSQSCPITGSKQSAVIPDRNQRVIMPARRQTGAIPKRAPSCPVSANNQPNAVPKRNQTGIVPRCNKFCSTPRCNECGTTTGHSQSTSSNQSNQSTVIPNSNIQCSSSDVAANRKATKATATVVNNSSDRGNNIVGEVNEGASTSSGHVRAVSGAIRNNGSNLYDAQNEDQDDDDEEVEEVLSNDLSEIMLLSPEQVLPHLIRSVPYRCNLRRGLGRLSRRNVPFLTADQNDIEMQAIEAIQSFENYVQDVINSRGQAHLFADRPLAIESLFLYTMTSIFPVFVLHPNLIIEFQNRAQEYDASRAIATLAEISPMREVRQEELGEKCIICLGDFEPQQNARALICEHKFHATCIDTWCQTSLTCPVCRRTVDGNTYERRGPSAGSPIATLRGLEFVRAYLIRCRYGASDPVRRGPSRREF